MPIKGEQPARYQPKDLDPRRGLLARVVDLKEALIQTEENVRRLQAQVIEKLYASTMQHGFTIHTSDPTEREGISYDTMILPFVLKGKNNKSIRADWFAVEGDRSEDTNTLSLIVAEDWPHGKIGRVAEYILSLKSDGTPGDWHGIGIRYLTEYSSGYSKEMNRRQKARYLKTILNAEIDQETINREFYVESQKPPEENQTRKVFWNKDRPPQLPKLSNMLTG